MEYEAHLKVIIFDFDGTLHNLNLDWQKAREILGIEASSQSMGSAIEELKAKSEMDRLDNLTSLEINALKSSKIDKVVKESIIQLSNKFRIAILSRNSHKAIKMFLDSNGISVDLIVGREDVMRLKPDLEGVKKVFSTFGVDETEVLMVGDTWHDVELSRNANMPCVIVGSNLKPDKVDIPKIETVGDLPMFLSITPSVS